ncbi:MAG: 50S ribosomal protein L4 [Thermoplasmata archaeon HGW-Thermoplasmata-1]|nr:MAG: 50S ribosomal protein L4 [Thermoplasmata archaeon HGW-Thermoplasmata-1]
MKVNVYKKDGSVSGEMELPKSFETPFRPDLIRKAVSVSRSNRRQPYGHAPLAGQSHSEYSWQTGRGASCVPRLSQGSRAVLMPGAVGGRRAHGPRPEKDWSEKINKKEAQLARMSALAATAATETVSARGHKFAEGLTLPVVVEDDFVELQKTKEVISVLKALGIYADVERAIAGRHIRAGIGKLRGRKYKTPRSLLIVASENEKLRRGARNLLGVDVTTPKELNTELLAPGGDAGRLTVFTKAALAEMEGF